MNLAEKLCYITTKTHTITPNASDPRIVSSSDATGFFVTLKCDSGDKVCLVTNRHVIDNRDKLIVFFTEKGADGNPIDSSIIPCPISLTHLNEGSDYYFHPEIDPFTGKPYDLCVFPFNTRLSTLEAQTGKQFYYHTFEEDSFMTATNMKSLSAIEDVIMVGYPCGLWDHVNNRPIIRKGITATDPKTNYLSSRMFVIDCACIQGSSGSPVLKYKDGLKAKVEGEDLNLTDDVDYMLLGIQQSIPEKKYKLI